MSEVKACTNFFLWTSTVDLIFWSLYSSIKDSNNFQFTFSTPHNWIEIPNHKCETKTRFRYRELKAWSSFGIGIGAKTFLSETKTYLFYFIQNFSNFIMFFCIFRGYEFLKTWNWTQIFKNELIFLIFGTKFGFRGPFMIEKIPHTYYRVSHYKVT
jgi:hypothetical protein